MQEKRTIRPTRLLCSLFLGLGLTLALLWALTPRSAVEAQVTNLSIGVNYAHEWVEGTTDPNATVIVTVANGGGVKATVTGQADGSGQFVSSEWSWDPEHPSIEPGDVVIMDAAGGGGYGDPLERDAGLVERDVAEGYVSLESARDDYGVVIDPSTMKVDVPATDELRSSLKK